MRLYKFILFIGIFVAVGVVLYWFKCQMGVNIIESFSWEGRIPVLGILQKHEKVVYSQPGDILIRSSFDELSAAGQWWAVYTLGKNLAEDKIVPDGHRDTKVLMVDNHSDDFWVKEHDILIAVKPGDRFAYSGLVSVEGVTRTYLGVTLYNDDRAVIEWNSFNRSMAAQDGEGWREMKGNFTIPRGVAYIRFRLSGQGHGRAFFDDVYLWSVR